MNDEPRIADERMKLFFKKILDLKFFVKQCLGNGPIESYDQVLLEIYEKLNSIIKEGD